MTLAAPSSTQPTPVDALSPLRFPGDLQLTPEQFWTVCSANTDAVLELDASGHLIHMTPTGGETGARNQALGALLWLAVRLERWEALTPAERRGFPPLCPDLVVELASPSDEGPRGLSALRRKMTNDQVNAGPLFQGLQIELQEIWSA